MKIKLATTREERRRWMEQWRSAAVALDEVKRDELANLGDAAAWQAADDLLGLAQFHRQTSDTSGLVEQQAWFQRIGYE